MFQFKIEPLLAYMCPHFHKKPKRLRCLWWHCMSDGLGLPTENLRFSMPACPFFFSINILVPRLRFKNEAKSWDIHRARLSRKSAKENMETSYSSVSVIAAVWKQFLRKNFTTKFFLSCYYFILYVSEMMKFMNYYSVITYRVKGAMHYIFRILKIS